MTNDNSNNSAAQQQDRGEYDLEERTAVFGESAIRFAQRTPGTDVNSPLIRQFVRAATSIGANYCEADDGVSRKDSRNKIGIAKKEARETKYWLRMISTDEPGLKEQARTLWQEAKELHLILVTIFRNTKID